MWNWSVRVILRSRIAILIMIGLVTVFLGYKATKVQFSYEMNKLLPENDSTYISYQEFKQRFGEDGSVIVLGVTNPDIFQLEEFNRWYELGNSIKKLDGIEEVVSIARTAVIEKDTIARKFTYRPLVSKRLSSQAEVDSIRDLLLTMPFYKGLLYNAETNAYLMAITLTQENINAKGRIRVVNNLLDLVEQYQKDSNHEVHCSGLPYIRTVTTSMIKDELFMFIIFSMVIAALIMFLFFRSFRVVLSSLIVVAVSIVWAMGILSILGYKITILTGVIPSLIVIIAIENCIYILNKYHLEYINHGNKIRALSRTIRRIGFASLMTNTATAMGFTAFILVNNKMFSEFGWVTSINIMLEFLLTITLFPIFLSFMKPPKERHTKHLDSKFFGNVTAMIVNLITNHRKKVYLTSILVVIVSIYGLTWMKTSGKVVDDLSKNDPIYVDLKYFESNFGGIMPFEISIDTKRRNGVLGLPVLKRINELQEYIGQYPEFSKPISLAEMVKFARQAFYSGDSAKYTLPSEMEKNFILPYIPQSGSESGVSLKSFVDSAKQITRISFQVADLGTNDMEAMLARIRPAVDSIFESDRYNVAITGNSVVYAKGTNFLINNLLESVIIAIILISLLMVIMFRSVKMILISMVPNLIPLLVTAAIMGFSGIPLKPSTLIVFSIALGISVDNAIQYLARYRHGLKINNNNIGESAVSALREASFSMIYTSIVLVLGFSVFTISDFGGTQALGLLISCTLFVAMFFNIAVLPSLLMSLDKYAISRVFTEDAIIEVYDTEEPEDNRTEEDK
ncbi:MAG: RND family transporter [Mangrovibacterium sp.]